MSDSSLTWLSVLQRWRDRMAVQGESPRTIGGLTGSAKTAIKYFESNGVAPGQPEPTNMKEAILASQKGPRGHAVMRAARELLTEATLEPIEADKVKAVEAERKAAKAEAAANRARAEVEPSSEHDNKEHPDMTINNRNEEQGDYSEDEELDETEQDGEVETPEDSIPPSRRPLRRRATVQSVAQPVFVMPQMRMPKQPRPVQPVQARNRVVKHQGKVRVYKRGDGGRRVLLNDYTVEEIGGSLQKFLKDWVDPDYGDKQSGVTTYEVVEIDERDMERGSPAQYTIESAPEAQTNAPMDQLRDAVGLIAELREMEESKASKNAELLTAAKKQALAGGDMSQMMMLLMMERMMGPRADNNGEALVMKFIDRLEKVGGAGSAHASSVPIAPPQFLPQLPFMPPAPAPASSLDKLIEIAIAKMANPPSLAEQLKELAMLKELMGGGGANAEMLAVMRAMAATAGQPREAAGIDAAVSMFEKLQNVVKTLAPQVNMGGLTGALQGILTPKLSEVIGNTLAEGMAKATGGGAPSGAGGAQQPAQQVPTQLPPEVVNKLAALRVAQTRPVQLEATVALVQAMWESPTFKPTLEPVLTSLLQGQIDPGQRAIAAILSDARPQLAEVTFVNDVLRLMATKAGMPIPDMLKEAPARPARITDNVPGLIETPNAKVIPLHDVVPSEQPAAPVTPPAQTNSNGTGQVNSTPSTAVTETPPP